MATNATLVDAVCEALIAARPDDRGLAALSLFLRPDGEVVIDRWVSLMVFIEAMCLVCPEMHQMLVATPYGLTPSRPAVRES